MSGDEKSRGDWPEPKGGAWRPMETLPPSGPIELLTNNRNSPNTQRIEFWSASSVRAAMAEPDNLKRFEAWRHAHMDWDGVVGIEQ